VVWLWGYRHLGHLEWKRLMIPGSVQKSEPRCASDRIMAECREPAYFASTATNTATFESKSDWSHCAPLTAIDRGWGLAWTHRSVIWSSIRGCRCGRSGWTASRLRPCCCVVFRPWSSFAAVRFERVLGGPSWCWVGGRLILMLNQASNNALATKSRDFSCHIRLDLRSINCYELPC